MSLSPGTERAICRLAEVLIPRLINSIEELATSAAKAAKPEPKIDGEIALTISLTPGEWEEVVNALSTRAAHIMDQGPSEDMNQEDVTDWTATLDQAYAKITKVLDRSHITY